MQIYSVAPRIPLGLLGVRHAPKRLHGGPKSPQDVPKTVQDGPKDVPKRDQDSPRGPQDSPSGPKMAPRGPKTAPRGSHDCPKTAPRLPRNGKGESGAGVLVDQVPGRGIKLGRSTTGGGGMSSREES